MISCVQSTTENTHFGFTWISELCLTLWITTVDNYILLNILRKRFCIQDIALDWFRSRSYLTGRRHLFVVGDRKIDTYIIDCSVNLVAYTDDLADIFEWQYNVSVHQYADDKPVQSWIAPQTYASSSKIA